MSLGATDGLLTPMSQSLLLLFYGQIKNDRGIIVVLIAVVRLHLRPLVEIINVPRTYAHYYLPPPSHFRPCFQHL